VTIRDHRLRAAARDWSRAQLQAGDDRRKAEWLARHAARLQLRAAAAKAARKARKRR
jgi:hypothetical protein